MSNIKISQLPPVVASVEDTDVIPIVDGGQTKKVTALDLQSYTQGNSVLLTGNQSIDGIKTFVQQIISSVATGTAPFQVASTTKVTNLNSDLLDGYTSDDFQLKLNGTGLVKSTSGTISYLTDNSSNWNTAYNDSIVSVSITGTTIKTLTLTQQDGGTLSAYWDNTSNNLVTSVFGRIGDVVAQTGDYDTSQVIEGSNLYYTQTRFNNAFNAKSTTDLDEGDNLYFTNLRASSAISNTATGLTYTSSTGVLSATSGYAIPTTASQSNWDAAYTNRITSASAPLSITSNAISISQATTSTNGYLSSTDWNTFNNKQASGNYITALTGEASASGPGSASVTLLNSAVIDKVLTGLNVTGGSISASDSILSAFGKVQNQINGLVGGVIYKGTWNASTNTPSLASSVGTQGWYYIVSVAGSTNLNGITDWNVGDWAIYDGSAWQKVDNTDSVISVNGLTGAVSLTTSNISEGTNLYFTQSRVSANTDVAANTAARHNAVTLGTANGLSLATQELSLGLSSASTNGALSSTDWSTFNAKQAALSGTGIVKSVGGTISYLTDNSTNWDTAYNDSIVSAAVTGTSTKTLTLNQQDGGTITASWSDADTGLTSVGLSMPSAFSVSNSPLTSNGTIAVTGAGTTAQYVRGDGSLATFPTIAQEAQRLITEVYNETGATLIKGTVVYINGGHGNLPTITKAIATGDSTSAQTYGIVQNDITNNNNGYVVVSGSINDIDTNSYTVGTVLYLSSTIAGAWTSVKQYAPAHLVYLGVVTRSHPTQGVVEIKIQNGYEMDELHNVAAQSPSNGDILQYVSSTNLWTKTAGTTSNIAEGSNLYYTDARARSAFSESVTGLDYNSTTGVLSTTSGYGIPTTASQANWDTAYGDSIISGAVTGTTTKTLTLNQQDGGTITASWNDYDTAPVTSVFGRTGAVVAASGDYTTTQVTEGTNLYYTDARFNTSFAAKSTTFLTEGTNLYFTNARAQAAISGSSPISVSSGVVSISQASGSANGYLSSTDWTTFNSKQNALTNPVTGTGTTNYLPKFTGTSALGDSILLQGTNNSLNNVFSSATGTQSFAGMFTGQGASGNTGVMFFGAGEPNGIDPSYPNIRAGLKVYQSWNGSSTDVKFDLFTLQGGIGGNIVLTGLPNGNAYLPNSVGIGTTSPARKLSVSTTANGIPLRLETDGSNTGIELIGGNTLYNFFVGKQYNISNAFEITPSTTAGGTTFSNPALVVTSAGNVGIGTTSPAGQLDVGSGYQRLLLTYPSTYVTKLSIGAGAFIQQDASNEITTFEQTYSAGKIDFNIGAGSTKVRIANTGNVLIGTTTDAGYKLDVNGIARVSGQLTVGSNIILPDSQDISWGTGGYGAYKPTISATDGVGIKFYPDGQGSGNTFTINTNGTATFSSSVTATQGTFKANNVFNQDGDGQITIRGASTPEKALLIGFDTTSNYGYLQSIWQGNSARPLVLQPWGGNVGIGTTSPADKLDVYSSDNSQQGLKITNPNGGGSAIAVTKYSNGTYTHLFGALGTGYSGYGVLQANEAFIYSSNQNLTFAADGVYSAIKFGTGAGVTERMRIDENGNVGINTTSPGSTLSVDGTGYFTGAVEIGNPVNPASATINTHKVEIVIAGVTYYLLATDS